MMQSWLAAGFVGAFCIDVYLSITQVLLFGGSAGGLQMWFASNVLGRAAFHYGAVCIGLGLFFHLALSLAWAACYLILTFGVPILRRNALVAGVGFGLVVFLVMTFIVVPLDAAPKGPMSMIDYGNAVIATTFFFGVPVALMANRRWRHN